MMRVALLPIILVVAAACTDTTTAPLRAPTAADRTVVGIGPTGAHLVTGTATPSCTVASDLSVTCNSYEIAGVGNTNAVANLSATYSATIDCFNPGVNPNNPIESHTSTFTTSASSGEIAPKNGRLTIPSLSVSGAFSVPQTCPNPNWTPAVRPGTLGVTFSYTVTFDGFAGPFISISGP
jgi:hypothetical protein